MKKIFIIFVYVLYLAGAFLHIYQKTAEFVISITYITLFFTATTIIAIEFYNQKKSLQKKFVIWLVLVFSITILAEIIGTNTGFIFGAYKYGDILGPKILAAPVVIGLNWITVVMGSIQITKFLNTIYKKYNLIPNLKINNIYIKTIIFIIVASLITVIFDFIMEPIAIKLGYWNWDSNYIPIFNYISWFIISAISILLYKLHKLNLVTFFSGHLFLAQLIFFLILSLF